MPRDDIHTAEDFADMIRREIAPRRIVTTGLSVTPTGDRNIIPIINTTTAAIKGTIAPDAQTDIDLLRGNSFHNRVSNPIRTVAATQRFDRGR